MRHPRWRRFRRTVCLRGASLPPRPTRAGQPPVEDRRRGDGDHGTPRLAAVHVVFVRPGHQQSQTSEIHSRRDLLPKRSIDQIATKRVEWGRTLDGVVRLSSAGQARGSWRALGTGRVCRGVELDPLYVDVIVRRYEAATGDAAVLVETGETYQALEARRATEVAPA